MSYVNIQDRKLPFSLRYLGDLMTYRHLCWNLVGSDLRSRFRRTRLGILWAFIQPLAFALMIAAVWGALQKSVSYMEFALYVFTGMVVFEMFATALQGGQDALMGAAGFVKQARIPFFIFQLRVVLSGLVMLLFSLIGIFLFSTAIGHPPELGTHLLLIPAFLPIIALFTLPIVIIMSIIGALYRDVRHIASLFERAMFLISPVMLPRQVLAEPQLRFLEFVNPMVPLIDMFRAPLVYHKMWEPQQVIVISIWIVGLWTIALITAASSGRKVVFAL
jgi:lipopolysaccharide transport system permease protein